MILPLGQVVCQQGVQVVEDLDLQSIGQGRHQLRLGADSLGESVSDDVDADHLDIAGRSN